MFLTYPKATLRWEAGRLAVKRRVRRVPIAG